MEAGRVTGVWACIIALGVAVTIQADTIRRHRKELNRLRAEIRGYARLP